MRRIAVEQTFVTSGGRRHLYETNALRLFKLKV
jgi:hypothetical protein